MTIEIPADILNRPVVRPLIKAYRVFAKELSIDFLTDDMINNILEDIKHKKYTVLSITLR